MGVPQSAQDILLLLLLRPGILLLVVEDSDSRRLDDMGSMVSWPVCMAARTERRESQLREGARSSLTAGSLNEMSEQYHRQMSRHTNLQKTAALKMALLKESSLQVGRLLTDARNANARQTGGIPGKEGES